MVGVTQFFYYYLCVGSLSWILSCYRKAPVMIIYCTHASMLTTNQSVPFNDNLSVFISYNFYFE